MASTRNGPASTTSRGIRPRRSTFSIPNSSSLSRTKPSVSGIPYTGNLQLLDEKWNGADVVFVTVREENRLHALRPVEEVRHVGNDDVDAERGGVGKHHSAIDDDGVVAVLVDHQVHPDLAEAAEGDDAQGCALAVIGCRLSDHRHGSLMRMSYLMQRKTATDKRRNPLITDKSDSACADTESSRAGAERR